MTETEVKIIEIDRKGIEKKVLSLGAKKIFDDQIETYFLDFDYPHISKSKNVLRLRRGPARAILTFKRSLGNHTTKRAKEYSVEVSDLDETRRILEELGLSVCQTMKKHRTSYELHHVRFEFDKYEDQYDFIPEFLEVEAKNLKTIHKYVRLLELRAEDCKTWPTSDLIDYYCKRSKKISQITKRLKGAGVPWVVISGTAVALWTNRRQVTDLDILVKDRDIAKVTRLFHKKSTTIRMPWGTSYGVAVCGFDFVGHVTVGEKCRFAMDDEILRRAHPKKLFNTKVQVASVEDNIALKAILQRGPDLRKRDKEDILLLKETDRGNPRRIDLRYLRKRLKICNALERANAFLESCDMSL